MIYKEHVCKSPLKFHFENGKLFGLLNILPHSLGSSPSYSPNRENNMRWNDYNKNWWDAHMKIFLSPYPGDKWARSKGCWFEIPLTENFTQNEASVCCGMKSILNNKNNMTKIIRTRPGAAWKLLKQIIHWQTLIRKKIVSHFEEISS